MNGTINGRNADVVLNALRKEIPEQCLKYSEELKITYIPADVVRKRMDEVLGNNYMTKYDAEVILIPDAEARQRPYVKATCSIEIIDDNGKVLLTRTGIGGSRVIQGKDNGSVLEHTDYNEWLDMILPLIGSQISVTYVDLMGIGGGAAKVYKHPKVDKRFWYQLTPKSISTPCCQRMIPGFQGHLRYPERMMHTIALVNFMAKMQRIWISG